MLEVAPQINTHDSDSLSKIVHGVMGVQAGVVTAPVSPPFLLRLLTKCLIMRWEWQRGVQRTKSRLFPGEKWRENRSPLPPAASWTEECAPASQLLARVNPFWQALKCWYSLAAQTLEEAGAGICPACLGSLELLQLWEMLPVGWAQYKKFSGSFPWAKLAWTVLYL